MIETASTKQPLAVSWTPQRSAIVAFQLAYGLLFVFHSSLVVHGTRYFMLFDDAMISMTYARTFVHGAGLVWYPGADPVQGFTNPLWTFVMVVAHLLPLPSHMTSLPIQLLGIALIPLTALYAEATCRLVFPDLQATWIVLLIVGCYFPFYQWSGLGMEAGFVTFLLAVGTHAVVRTIADRRIHPAAFYSLGAGVLTRLDYAIFAAVCVPAVLYAVRRDPGQRRRGAAWTGLLGLLLAAVCLVQFAYYGNPLPNTYFLKLGVPLPVRLAAGLASTRSFAESLSYPLVVLAFATPWLRRMQPQVAAFAVALVASATAYNLYTGGDAWEWGPLANRFQLPITPILFVLVAGGLDYGVQRLGLGARATKGVLVGLALITVLRVNSGPLLEPDAARLNLRKAALLEPILTREFHDLPQLKAGLLLRDASTAPLRVAVSSAGITPYVLGRGSFIDLLGCSDPVVAHEAPKDVAFVPGHVKWDLHHSIDRLDPDVCIGTWCRPPDRYPEPMVAIPGNPFLYVKKRSLRGDFVPLRDLLSVYRRYEYGPDLQLFAFLFEMRGFRVTADRNALEMASVGSFLFPADAVLSFEVQSIAPRDVSVWSAGKRVDRFRVLPGEIRSYRIEGAADEAWRLVAEPPDSEAGGAPPALRIGRFDLL